MLYELILVELLFLSVLFLLIYGIIIFTDMKFAEKRYKYILCVLFDIFIIFGLYNIIPNYIVPIGMILIYLNVIFVFDESFLKKSKFSIVLYCSISVISITLSLLEQILQNAFDMKIEYTYFVFINYFIIFVIFTLCRDIKLKKELNKSIESNYIGIASVILIVCSACFFFIYQRNRNKFNEGFTSFYIICTFVGCIILMLLFVFFVQAEKEKIYYMYESQLKGALMESNAEHYRLTLESYNEFRKQRHDFRGHLIVMQDYVKNKNFDLLDSYMSEIYENYVLADKLIHVNNEVADSMLNYFSNRASQENIDFKCEGKFRTEISMSSFQLCTCFYNLLNNAVEACRKIKDGERSIIVTIKSYKDTQILTVENTVSEPVDKKYWATGLSSKPDAKLHGFGLMSVKSVVAELDGQILFKNTENSFQVKIILPPALEDDKNF